jgi:hypothetical protein
MPAAPGLATKCARVLQALACPPTHPPTSSTQPLAFSRAPAVTSTTSASSTCMRMRARRWCSRDGRVFARRPHTTTTTSGGPNSSGYASPPCTRACAAQLPHIQGGDDRQQGRLARAAASAPNTNPAKTRQQRLKWRTTPAPSDRIERPRPRRPRKTTTATEAPQAHPVRHAPLPLTARPRPHRPPAHAPLPGARCAPGTLPPPRAQPQTPPHAEAPHCRPPASARHPPAPPPPAR